MPRVSNAKLNNFSRLEPTLHLLGVQFDQNVAHSIITEKPGAATKLLYQLYTVLQKKKKSGLTAVEMRTMQPPANARYQSMKSEAFRDVSTQRIISIPPCKPWEGDMAVTLHHKKCLVGYLRLLCMLLAILRFCFLLIFSIHVSIFDMSLHVTSSVSNSMGSYLPVSLCLAPLFHFCYCHVCSYSPHELLPRTNMSPSLLAFCQTSINY